MPCPGEAVTFSLQMPLAGATYTWDLDGDNQADDGTGTTVTYTYPISATPVNYTVRVFENGAPACGSPKIINVKAGPDLTIGVTTGQTFTGTLISTCAAAQSVLVGINNTTPPATAGNNTGYSIDWGDGSPVQNFTNATFNANMPVTHTFSGLGYKTILITATHQNGCSYTRQYQYFNGSNPSVGLGTLGNSVGLCAPATLMFPLNNIAGNPPGTIYTFFENDIQIAQYTQATLPAVFSHTFDESSCGETTPDGSYINAFAIKVEASNPCGSSSAIVQPITLSTPPTPDFSIQGPANHCPDAIFTFRNTSTNINEYNTVTHQCADTLNANWTISPGALGVDYQITSGSIFNSNQIKVRFLTPGVYTISMTLNPTPVCGPAVITKTVTILEPPTADATAMFSNPNGCVPQTVTFDNHSTGYQVSYSWAISPANGWSFASGSNANSFEPTVVFSAPGVYTVTLTAQNVCDDDTWTTTITVKDRPSIVLPTLGPFCQTATLNFSAQNTQFNANNGTISTYAWSFPGGMPSSSGSPYPTGIQYSVTTETMFTVSVSVTNECGTSMASTNFTVQVPPALNMPPDLTLCSNAMPEQLNATPSGGTWSGPGISPAGLFNPASAGAPGVKTLIYMYGVGVCQIQGTMQVTVSPLPVVNAGMDQSACVDMTTLTLTGTPSGGIWTSSSGGIVAGSNFNPSQSGTGNFTLTYTYSNADNCTNADALVVMVNPLPVITVADTTYCNAPGLVSLPVALPAGGTWSGTGVSGNQFDPIGAGGIGTYQVTYSYTNPVTHCSNTRTINIAVINPSTVNAGPDLSFCADVTSVNLQTNASPPGGSWSTVSAGLTGNIFNPGTAGPGMHILTYSVGAGNCLVQDTRIITVFALPVVNAGLDASSCVDNNSVALSGTPANGIWTSSGSGVVNGNSFFPSQSGAGTFTLTYTFIDGNNCVNTDALDMVVHPLPVVQVQDTVYCNAPGFVALPVATPAGGQWSGPGITNNQFNPTGAGGVGTYPAVYSYTNPNTLCSNTDTIEITIINPVTVNAGVDTAFCVSVTAFDLSAGAVPVSGGAWTSSGGGLQGTIFNPNTAGPGIYTLTYRVGAGNCLVEDTRTIEVWALPVVNAGLDASVCITGDDVTLNPSPANGIWTASAGAVLNGNTFDPMASGAGNFDFTYTFSDGNGCVNTDHLSIVVHPLPVLVVNDTTYCNTPGTVLLPVVSPAGGAWSGPSVSGNQFNPITAGGVGSYNLIYSFTDTNSCTDSTDVEISVIDPPVVYAGADDTICMNTGLLQLGGFLPASGGQWSGPGIINVQTGIFDPTLAGGGTHSLVYAFGAGNCRVKDTVEIRVIAADIEAGLPQSACLNDLPITLSGFNPAGGAWSGAGISNPAGVFNPSLAQVGVHTLYYEFVDPVLGCTFEDSLVFTVNPMPESDFAQPTETCIHQDILFDNLSQSTFDVLWKFGDGATSTLPEPTHAYSDTGSYVITLITRTEFGCIDSISKSIYVTEPPTAQFVMAPDSGCAVLNVSFNNQSYGYQTIYHWDFGNGDTSNLFTPGVISYEQGNSDTNYIIVLRAQNLCATREWRDTVKVFPLPIVDFGTTLDTICTGDFIEFNNITLGNPDSFLWDFGNGLTSTDSIPGDMQYFTDTLFRTYTIQLIATNFCGSDTSSYDVVVKPSQVKAFFNIPVHTGCQPFALEFTNFSTPGASVSWNFGDGNTSNEPNPVHTFLQAGTFKVVQKVSSGCGYDSTFTLITVLPAPDVSFTSLPQVCRGDTLAFTNTSESLSGTFWTFGDGDSSILYHTSHIWSQSGTYTVQLTGTSSVNGCPASYTDDIVVLELPLIRFVPDALDGCIPLTIAFDNQSQGAAYFEWNFGDGNTQTGTDVSHIYTQQGQYSVGLVGIDLNGCQNDTVLHYITAHPVPSAAFTLNRDKICGVPVAVHFENQSSGALGFLWNFGNGITSVENNPATIYADPGSFFIALTATNTFGCKDTTVQEFNAYAVPVTQFAWTPDEGCAPLEVQFQNLSEDDTEVLWLFTDGSTSTSDSPTHTFSEPGIHGATLITSYQGMCFDTLPRTNIILVKPSPVANFSFVEIVTTPPSGSFSFIDLSMDASTWEWDFGDQSATSNDQNPAHRYYSNGSKLVTLAVTSLNGCTDDTSQLITPMSIRGLFIPNAFTPGLSNGEAAFFKPKGVGLKEYEIAVYSSFGQLLWRSDKLENGQPAEAWDGTFQDKLLPQDVYTWQVKKAVFEDGGIWEGNFDAGSGKGKKVGSVMLIR
ncbi:MAG TPA: PKD domain-containing protein [Saprospiraceae bacterium]|nr:PKD domain-containing protein [Saprospiraceae bacterium]